MDYGRSSNAPPPMAPNAARRGNSFASINDFPAVPLLKVVCERCDRLDSFSSSVNENILRREQDAANPQGPQTCQVLSTSNR